tara:strand:- start:174 stop:419 length:246 start_codon:yes stop_codon:yes gene_type:complete
MFGVARFCYQDLKGLGSTGFLSDYHYDKTHQAGETKDRPESGSTPQCFLDHKAIDDRSQRIEKQIQSTPEHAYSKAGYDTP